jgi:hypothetical protein
MNKNELEIKITEFWNKDIWKSNVKYIHNEKIKDIITQIQKLSNQNKPNKKFFLLNDGELKIKSEPKINIQIEKIINDNLTYIKSHADAIPEYHNLIISLKKQYLFLTPV